MFPKSSRQFLGNFWGRNLHRRFPGWRKSFPVSRVQRVLGKYLGAMEWKDAGGLLRDSRR